MPLYQQGEDMENYLLRFERMAKTWVWPEGQWACRLVPLLTGKALEAYTAMDEERSDVYRDLKEALLRKFDITPETYRLRFRLITAPPGETPRETYDQLKGLYRRWMHPEIHSKEEIGETVILEQLLKVLPHDMRIWVKEHEPKDGVTAAKLAGQYHDAHRGTPPGSQRQPSYHSNPTRSRETWDNSGRPVIGTPFQRIAMDIVGPLEKSSSGHEFILVMRDRLEKYRSEAQENLAKAQKTQKAWYNQHARHREFQAGQKVLLLLPTSTHKLLAKWQGPFKVVRKAGPVTYEVAHPDKGKATQVYHINLLKEWKERSVESTASEEKTIKTALMVRRIEEEDEDVDLSNLIQPQGADLSHLPEGQQQDLQHSLAEFPALFSEMPGKTLITEHVIRLNETTPIRQRPYRVPERLRGGGRGASMSRCGQRPLQKVPVRVWPNSGARPWGRGQVRRRRRRGGSRQCCGDSRSHQGSVRQQMGRRWREVKDGKGNSQSEGSRQSPAGRGGCDRVFS
ncbi:hypothetical protein AAFF_G00095030 [Aldrovandia affinis]|uniref:SCAN box domain-containing protein n=1 Tax=Aldrovandia affinis TaxID=143900 RepID=A0AAD7RY98_9TELE|nr:hypothetical protein AAFF_G00095030 [Aldrovandia affinis]